MNERIQQLADEAAKFSDIMAPPTGESGDKLFVEKFAQLIIEDCRAVLYKQYDKTPLELCGPLLTVDEEIMNHFYGVE